VRTSTAVRSPVTTLLSKEIKESTMFCFCLLPSPADGTRVTYSARLSFGSKARPIGPKSLNTTIKQDFSFPPIPWTPPLSQNALPSCGRVAKLRQLPVVALVGRVCDHAKWRLGLARFGKGKNRCILSSSASFETEASTPLAQDHSNKHRIQQPLAGCYVTICVLFARNRVTG
jgi:hypothetical protein